MSQKTYSEEWNEQFDRMKKAFSEAAINLEDVNTKMKNKPIIINMTKEEIQDKKIAAMDIDLKFLWDKAKVNEKKTNELESKTTRMDEGCKDMWERITLTMKTVQALDGDVQWIKLQNQIGHDREVELRQTKARKKAKAVDIIDTVMAVIIFVFALVGVAALASGFLGV